MVLFDTFIYDLRKCYQRDCQHFISFNVDTINTINHTDRKSAIRRSSAHVGSSTAGVGPACVCVQRADSYGSYCHCVAVPNASQLSSSIPRLHTELTCIPNDKMIKHFFPFALFFPLFFLYFGLSPESLPLPPRCALLFHSLISLGSSSILFSEREINTVEGDVPMMALIRIQLGRRGETLGAMWVRNWKEKSKARRKLKCCASGRNANYCITYHFPFLHFLSPLAAVFLNLFFSFFFSALAR